MNTERESDLLCEASFLTWSCSLRLMRSFTVVGSSVPEALATNTDSPTTVFFFKLKQTRSPQFANGARPHHALPAPSSPCLLSCPSKLPACRNAGDASESSMASANQGRPSSSRNTTHQHSRCSYDIQGTRYIALPLAHEPDRSYRSLPRARSEAPYSDLKQNIYMFLFNIRSQLLGFLLHLFSF